MEEVVARAVHVTYRFKANSARGVYQNVLTVQVHFALVK